jgi:hypothetical protein
VIVGADLWPQGDEVEEDHQNGDPVSESFSIPSILVGGEGITQETKNPENTKMTPNTENTNMTPNTENTNMTPNTANTNMTPNTTDLTGEPNMTHSKTPTPDLTDLPPLQTSKDVLANTGLTTTQEQELQAIAETVIQRQIEVDSAPRYPTRERTRVDKGPFVGNTDVDPAIAFDAIKIPKTIKMASKTSYWTHWQEAVKRELDALYAMGTWEIVNRENLKSIPVDCKWVFNLKRNEDSSIKLFKARLTAKGFQQEEGFNYYDTYAPVARTESFRLVVAAATLKGLKLTQVDFSNAFLNAKLEEEVYMNYPPMYPGKEGTVLKLRRAIYGLRQSPRAWFLTLKQALNELGFEPTESDRCVFRHKKETFIITMHVDDLVLATDNEAMRTDVLKYLSDKYKMKDMGRLHKYLGIRIKHQPDNTITFDQEQYIRELLTKHGMTECNQTVTPMDPNLRLSKTHSPDTPGGVSEMSSYPYREIVGALNYALTCTRPDIAFALISCARYVSNPGMTHWHALKRILRYLKGTPTRGLRYGGKGVPFKVWGMCDSDWAGDIDSRRSRLGYLVYLGNGPVAWKSTQQKTAPALSSAEAEFLALCELMKELLWVHHFLTELRLDHPQPIEIYLDNRAAKFIAEAKKSMKGVRHIDTKLLFLRYHVEHGTFKLVNVDSKENSADIFTKAVSNPIFSHLIPNIMSDTTLRHK